jgi:hypothetical protein
MTYRAGIMVNSKRRRVVLIGGWPRRLNEWLVSFLCEVIDYLGGER